MFQRTGALSNCPAGPRYRQWLRMRPGFTIGATGQRKSRRKQSGRQSSASREPANRVEKRRSHQECRERKKVLTNRVLWLAEGRKLTPVDQHSISMKITRQAPLPGYRLPRYQGSGGLDDRSVATVTGDAKDGCGDVCAIATDSVNGRTSSVSSVKQLGMLIGRKCFVG